MTKIPMNKLTAKAITLEETNELLAAVESVKLWQIEIERAEKARENADKYLEHLIAKSLKQSSLKFLEGELITLPEYHKIFCYMHEDFISIPVPEEYINEGIL
jgi:hypothetical protein